jgi:RNA polymerase sigma factor (sigma-70 family)
MSRETTLGGGRRDFEQTSWTLVLKARDLKDLGALFERYWKPCYFFIRRKGHDVEDAKDLTQGFFGDLFQRDGLARVTRSKGRFRTYLLACLDHFLSNEYDRRKALKRGGGRKIVSLDVDGAEDLLSREDEADPERAFRREWARGILDRASRELRGELGARFDALKEYITAGQPTAVAEIADKLGLSESNVKVIVHRARKRYRELLQAEVARTVDSRGDVESELSELFKALVK